MGAEETTRKAPDQKSGAFVLAGLVGRCRGGGLASTLRRN